MIRQRLKSLPSTDAKERGKTQPVTCSQRPPLRFDQAETKLLYTLQWLLLDAASECADNDPYFKSKIRVMFVSQTRKLSPLLFFATYKDKFHVIDYIHLGETTLEVFVPLSYSLFIYLFAPVLERLKCEDFDTLKLESGLRLWAPLILHRQPYEGSFPVPVKIPSGQYDEGLNVNPLRSYVDQFGPLPTVFQRPGEELGEEDELGGLEAVCRVSSQVPHSIAPFYPTSPNLRIPNAESSDEDSAWYDRHSVPISASALKQSHNRPVVPMARLNDICPVSLQDTDSEQSESNCSESFTTGRSYLEQTLEEQIESLTQTVLKEAMATDTVLASHCDLAVMRCLFSPEWSEAGAVWALRYLERRLTLLRHERRRERVEASVYSRFQRLRATLPEAFFAAADAVTGQAADLGVLRSLSMPQLAPPYHHYSFGTSNITAMPSSQRHITTGSASVVTATTDIGDDGDDDERYSAEGRRKLSAADGTGGDEKHSTSLSQKSSSSDQQSSNTESQPMSTAPAPHPPEPTMPPTLHHFLSDLPSSQARLVNSDALVTSSSSGTFYKRKQIPKPSLEQNKNVKRTGVFEIKDRLSRHGKGRPDLGHANHLGSNNLLDEPTLSKPLSDESILEDPSGFLTVPPTDARQMEANIGGILRRSNRTPLSPKSVADLIDLRDDRLLVSNTKSQISLNEARFFGSDVTMNLDEATDSQNSIDAGSANFDSDSGFLLHRCHSDTNISYNMKSCICVFEVDEVTGSNHYIKRNGQINCATVLRGLYWICNLQNSIRVCDHLLKNVYCLIDLCTLTWEKSKSKKQSKLRKCYRQPHEDSAHSSVTRLSRRTYGHHVPHTRSKSVAILGLQSGLNYTPSYSGKVSHVPSRGSSIVTHDGVGSVEKLVRVTGSGRLIPFGRSRNRRQIPVDDGDERSAEMSSDEENSTTRSIRAQQMRPNFRKSDKYLNVDCQASAQVRFQSRKQVPTRHFNTYSFRRSGEIPACGPTRLLPNRLRVVDKRPQRKVRTEEKTTSQEKTLAMLADEQQQATINFSLIMEILVKIIRVLGCSYGHQNVCGSGGGGGGLRSATGGLGYSDDPTGAVAAMLRRHAHECLLRMFHSNKNLFYCFFSRFIAAVPITELMEFLHGLTSFCLDPVVLNPTKPGSSEKWSYHNSFGQSFTGEGTRGAEGVIICSLMGTLVRRFVRCRRELATQENISLFTEVRHLLTYLKSVHGNTFRRALLCSLLCPMRTALMRNKPSMLLPRPRMLSTRNSLWPTSASKRPSMVIPSTDYIDVGDFSFGLQNKRLHGQNWKSETENKAHYLIIFQMNPAETKCYKPMIERRLVDLPALKENLRDFAFLLECLEPGTLPEPQLVASFLDLNAPVLARACLLLECAFFVHRCNRGEWPAWMKINLPLPIQQAEHLTQSATSSQRIAISISGPASTSADPIDLRSSAFRTTAQIQWSAGRLFHSWAEVQPLFSHFPSTGFRIRIMAFLEGNSSTEIYLSRDFQSDENFLDDATVNPNGDSCPYALLVMAVQLLNEITTFLRESHQHATRAQVVAPSSSSSSSAAARTMEHSSQWDGSGGANGLRNLAGSSGAPSFGALKSTRRRLSILMPMFAQSEVKDKHNSVYLELSNVRGEDGDTASRVTDEYARKSVSKSLTRKRQRSGSFRQSFQLSSLMGNPRSTKAEGGLRRMSSRASTSGGEGVVGSGGGPDTTLDDGSSGASGNQTSRHAPPPSSSASTSLRPEAPSAAGVWGRRSESGEALICPETDVDLDVSKRSPRRDRRRTSLGAVRDPSRSFSSRAQNQTLVADFYSSNMPWIPAVIAFAKRTTFGCKHQPTCEANCFDRQQQQLRSLLQAIRQVYSATTESSFIRSVDELPEGRRVRGTVSDTVSTPDARSGNGGATSCQCISDSFSGAGKEEEESVYSDEVNDSDQDITGNSGLEDLLRLALNPTPLLRGPAPMSTFGVVGGDPELETSASILHRVFGGRDHQDKRNALFNKNVKRKESSVFTSGWREATTPIFDRFRRKGTPKRGSGAGVSDDGVVGGFCGPGGLSSLMNLSLLAGAGTGLTAANSSPSLVRLLEAVKSGLANGTTLSVEGDDAQSEEAELGKTKVRPLAHQTDSPELMYLDTQVQSLRSSFFNLLNKGALLLSSEQLEEVVPLAWELLLEADPELTSSAASLILFAAVKCSAFIQKLLYTELQHMDLNNRLNAVLRFRALWTARQQVWSRLEEGASQCLKVPPPLIEYVLPSPTLGNPSVQVPDPAWETRKGTSAEEVQLKQNEATKTFVTASTSRRKQQQELLARAVTAAKLARDEARSLFHITTSAILELAATEVVFSKDHRGDEAGSGEDDNEQMFWAVAGAANATIAPTAPAAGAADDEAGSNNASMLLTHQLKMAQTFFPSCICAATLPLTNLMDDCTVNNEGIAVSTVVETVIWQCLLEDTSLFLRYIFEKLTRVPHKDDLISVIRKLVQRLPELPMQTAHILFNNLVGCIMFHVRTPSFDAPDSIASILCVLHMIIPYVKNIYFKDLKQTFRREQIDSTLLVTANLPCAKQFNVFCDTICVAQLVKLQDDNKDYRFNDILTEALEGNGVPHSEYHLHVLCDDRSNIIRNSNHYVRDFYPFKRNHIPKLKLMRVDRETGQQLLQRNAFSLKVQEVGKLLLVKTILQTTAASHMSNHILFLREELVKLPSFPRKALEAEFTLYECGDMGKALFAMDSMHKLTWCQLINSMFQKMTSTFPWSTDLQLFLNVYNGTLVLHAEDTTILRQCLAFYLQCCYQFKMIFSVNGYLSILPTIIRVYHNNQHNGILKQAIEFIFKQFYIMHRTPFVLQMFGSIANYIDLSPDDTAQSNFYRVMIQPETLYQLLRAIGREIPDTLGILQLCSFSKPLKALVYAPESYRSRQMMVILQAIFPYILRDLPTICCEECTGADSRKFELQAIQQLSVMVKQLICTTEWMTRRSEDTKSVVSSTTSSSSVPGGPRGLGGASVKRLATADQPVRMPEWASAISGNFSNRRHHPRHLQMQQNLQRSLTRSGSPSTGAIRDGRRRPPSAEFSSKRSMRRQRHSGDSFGGASGALKRSASAAMSGSVGGGGSSSSGGGGGDSGHHIGTPAGWRKSSIEPREAILQIASEFLTIAHRRLGELGERQKSSELLDGKAFMRLSELAQSIVKQFPHNVNLLKSQPLQRFFMEVLPLADWSHESLRSCKALETLVGRLNRTLPKMLETASVRLFNDYLKRSLVVGPNAWWSSERLFTTPPQATITMVTAQHLGRRATTTAGGDRIPLSPTSTGSTLTSSLAKGASSSPSGERVSATAVTGGAVETSCLPAGFASEATRFIALMLSCLESSYRLKDLCERANFEFCRCPTIFEGGTENLSNYLAYLIVPLLFHCSTGRGDCPSLSKENVYYALEVCLSGLFVGSEKYTSTCGVASSTGTETVGAVSSRPSGVAFDHMAFEAPRKLGIHSSFMLANSKPNQPMGAMGEGCGVGGGGGSGGLKTSLGQSMSGTVGVTGLLQLPNLLGGPPVTGSTWELIGPSGLACDLGGGRVHGCVVNLIGPTLHSMRHPKVEEMPGAATVGTMGAVTNTAFSGNSVGVSHASTSILSSHEKNVQSQIDVVHKLAFLGLKLILIVYPRHTLAKSLHIIASLAKLAFYRCCGVQLWKFLDFVVTYRPSIFMHMAPFFRFQMLNLMRQKHQLFLSPRQMHDSSMFSPSAPSDSANSVASAPLPGILRHPSEKHFSDTVSITHCIGILEGGQVRPFSQIEFRQSLLRRTSGKRISAHDGSRFLSHHRTLSQRKPILTASVESLPRQSGPPGGPDRRHRSNEKTKGELRRAMTNVEGGEGRSGRYFSSLANTTLSPQDNDIEDDDIGSRMDELNAPANPLIAAAVATSLYGSAAPYTHVREKAREELPDLIGMIDSSEPYKQSRPLMRSSKLTDNIPLVDLHTSPSTSFPPITPPSPPQLQDPAFASSFDSQSSAVPQRPRSQADTLTKIRYV
ncbi:unnamed protein product [Taenia asiatica]|uniref:UNC80 domain-containing protein n=1 Tax=Taenia asiatica TaxID=60517 RepID=A0A0R3VST7_TAEAS|nr:unnamed protein product [Taenia asiatica]